MTIAYNFYFISQTEYNNKFEVFQKNIGTAWINIVNSEAFVHNNRLNRREQFVIRVVQTSCGMLPNYSMAKATNSSDWRFFNLQ